MEQQVGGEQSEEQSSELSVRLSGVTLHVADVERSREFYARIPGARLVMHRAGAFAMFEFGGMRLGLLKWPSPTFHIEMDSPDPGAMHEMLIANGITPESPPQSRPWGQRDFHVLDPDGNTLEFG